MKIMTDGRAALIIVLLFALFFAALGKGIINFGSGNGCGDTPSGNIGEPGHVLRIPSMP